jgi:uncharacterized protein YjbJ (UPF0337 family)
MTCVRCRTDGTFARVHAGRCAGQKLGMTLRAIAPIDHQERTVNKDQVKGRLKQAEGKVKEVAGKLTGNKTLEQKGKVKNAAGDVQADYGDLKNDVAKSL